LSFRSSKLRFFPPYPFTHPGLFARLGTGSFFWRPVMSLFQPVEHLTATQTVDQIFAGTYQGNNSGSLFCFFALTAIVFGLAFVSTVIKEEKRSKSRSKISHNILPKDEELPVLAPVAASTAPEVETITAVPVVEPAPAPVVDPTFGWSKPVIDEAVLDTPAYIRRAGITLYAAYRRLNPLKVPVVLLSKALKPSLDSEPVFDFGERLPVGFDGLPVH